MKILKNLPAFFQRNAKVFSKISEMMLNGTAQISGRVDRVSTTETVDSGSIPVGSNQRLKIGIHSLPA